MADSTTEQMPASVREWTEILARIRFGKVKAAGKTITGASIKAVAGRLASYADGNGRRVRPGVARVALDLEVDMRTVKTAMAHLRAVGLLQLVRPGGRRGADEYRLTLPVDLLERDDLTVWSPTEQRAEIERLSDANRGTFRTPPRGPGGGGSRGPQAPANEPASQGPQAPDKGPDVTPISGASGASNDSIMGACGSVYGGPQAPATHQDLDTTTTHHPDEDLRTDVTGPRVPEAGSPNRCPAHRMKLQPRTDGLNPCPLCRAGAPPTPEKGSLAPVIQLDSRRPA